MFVCDIDVGSYEFKVVLEDWSIVNFGVLIGDDVDCILIFG